MEQIGDMLILEKTEYKYNHQYYKVKCIICGHEREVSLHNLKKKGSKHCYGSCKDDFYKHEFIGKKYGDYTVIKYDHNDMRMVLKCNICGNITKASISELKEKHHSPICCRETYYKNQIGKEYGDFIILDYNLSKTPKYLVIGKIYNVNGRSVGNCLRGKSKSAGGWTFKNITKEEFEVLLKEDGSVTTKVVI